MITLLILLLSAPLFAGSRWVDGKIELVKYHVNGVECWTDSERDKEISKYNLGRGTFPPVVTQFVPTEKELALSSSGLKFTNYTDYVASVQDKRYLGDKLMDLPPSKQKEAEYLKELVK